jgi:4-alpha-glucanotransferase
MKLDRAAGVLLHPTSLPGPFGIGDLGPQAERWVDFLAYSGISLWQVLPLGVTGFGNSPYSPFSSHAGNQLLVSPERLRDDGLVDTEELERPSRPFFPASRIDFGRLKVWKLELLARAADRFEDRATHALREEYRAFCAHEADWLDDFALYMALKAANDGLSWNLWEAPLRHRDPAALAAARESESVAFERRRLWQFFFHRQWRHLRAHAHGRGIRILGDMPIYVPLDCADVWRWPELFELDAWGQPTKVAGVPPDYFSPTGQLWGNPLYRWPKHEETRFAWWIRRVKKTLEHFDVLRLDHFRGLCAYWEIEAGSPTAEIGQWRPAPGDALLRALRESIADLPLMAEDLGDITPDVYELRDKYGLPGMKVLQFAFNGGDSEFLPHHHVPQSVVYTGTHDNDTAQGWFKTAPRRERDNFARYRGSAGSSVAWDLIRMAWSSVAGWAIVPAQDLLGLGSRARMNHPGHPFDQWAWRLPPNFFESRAPRIAMRLREMNTLYGRLPMYAQNEVVVAEPVAQRAGG